MSYYERGELSGSFRHLPVNQYFELFNKLNEFNILDSHFTSTLVLLYHVYINDFIFGQ